MSVGELAALLAIVIFPTNVPDPCAEKTTLNVARLPAAMLVGSGPTDANGVSNVTLEIDSVAVPGFKMVTTTGELTLANEVAGKIISVGETLIAG